MLTPLEEMIGVEESMLGVTLTLTLTLTLTPTLTSPSPETKRPKPNPNPNPDPNPSPNPNPTPNQDWVAGWTYRSEDHHAFLRSPDYTHGSACQAS